MGEAARTAHCLTSHTYKKNETTHQQWEKSPHFHPHNEPRTRTDPYQHAKALTRARQTEPAGKTSWICLRGVINLRLPGCTYGICSAPSHCESLSSTLRAKISATPSGSHPLLPPRPHHLPLVKITKVAGSYPAKCSYMFKLFHRRAAPAFSAERQHSAPCEGRWAQLRVSWAPWVRGAVKELCSSLLGSWRVQLSQPWPWEEANRLGTARPVMWLHSPSLWSLGFAGAELLPQVLYLALHQHFKKAVCLQVCHTPHPEPMPALAALGDLYRCQQESVEKCPSCCQVPKSPSERGCQWALSFLTLLSFPLSQSHACWHCSKMFPRAFPTALSCLSTAADDIPRVTLILAQEAITDHYTSNWYPNIGLKITNGSLHTPLSLNWNCRLDAREGAGNALTLPPPHFQVFLTKNKISTSNWRQESWEPDLDLTAVLLPNTKG